MHTIIINVDEDIYIVHVFMMHREYVNKLELELE